MVANTTQPELLDSSKTENPGQIEDGHVAILQKIWLLNWALRNSLWLAWGQSLPLE